MSSRSSGCAPLVVVGDALLDREVSGSVARVCNDSPAPVFDEDSSWDRPGGAALAAALAAQADPGRQVRLVAAVGHDPAGHRLRQLLDETGVELVEMPYQASTAEKIRLHAGRQVVLRLDRNGTAGPIGAPDERASAALNDAAAILVSDYGRGMAGVTELRRMLAMTSASRPVVWDPHPRGRDPVPGLHLVTPNERELPGMPEPTGNRLERLARHAAAARNGWRAAAVAVTMGADGALLMESGAVPLVVPTPMRADADPCGAGDRFAGAATAAMADGAMLSEAVQAAVEAASGFVARDTGRPPSRQTEPTGFGLEQARRVAEATHDVGGTVVATGGCFDLLHAGHVATLRAARELGDCLIVCVNSDAGVRRLKGVHRPVVNEEDRARVVGALSSVDAVVIFDEPTPVSVLSQLKPDIWVKGGDYFFDGSHGPTLPEAEHVAAWGGQTVVVPYLGGRSTTNLIHEAARRL